jgi:hypothetical protein
MLNETICWSGLITIYKINFKKIIKTYRQFFFNKKYYDNKFKKVVKYTIKK